MLQAVGPGAPRAGAGRSVSIPLLRFLVKARRLMDAFACGAACGGTFEGRAQVTL